MNENIFVETPRLIINKLQENDFDISKATQKDHEVMRFFGGPLEDNKIQELFSQYIWHMNQYGFSIGPVYEKSTGSCIGRAGLIHLDFGNSDISPDIEIASLLFSQYWGKGYATELCENLIRYAFTVLNYPKVFATVDPNNIASCKVCEKLGMTFYKKEIYKRLDKKVNFYIKYRDH